ncbi:MAG: hypothetical protein U0R78_05405 [Nocardioidaceae bacterium]
MLYAILGGFPRNAQLAESPAGSPTHRTSKLQVRPHRQRLLDLCAQLTVIAVITTVLVVVLGRWPPTWPAIGTRWRKEPLYMVFVVGLPLFPATVTRSSRCSSW